MEKTYLLYEVFFFNHQSLVTTFFWKHWIILMSFDWERFRFQFLPLIKFIENLKTQSVGSVEARVGSIASPLVAALRPVQTPLQPFLLVCFSLPGLPNNSAASAPWERVGVWLELMQPEQETCVETMPAINVGSIPTRQVFVTRYTPAKRTHSSLGS